MQGVVYWQPPEAALSKVEKIIREPSISKYGADDGLPELREALLKKVPLFSISGYICFLTLDHCAMMLPSLATMSSPPMCMREFFTRGYLIVVLGVI
jgi:hypothetical protein